MTIQDVFVLAGIVSAFTIFGVVLAWADFYTQRRPKSAIEDTLTTDATLGSCATSGSRLEAVSGAKGFPSHTIFKS